MCIFAIFPLKDLLVYLPAKIQKKTRRKSGIWDRDSKLKNLGSGTGTGTQICGTSDSGTQLCGTVPGTENFPGHGPGPVPTPEDNLISQETTNCKFDYKELYESF